MSIQGARQPLKLHPIFFVRDVPILEEKPKRLRNRRSGPSSEEGPPIDRFSSLPRELILMICFWLPTEALFRVSRVSKLFRQLIMTKTSEAIWRNARRRSMWEDLKTGDFDELKYAKYIALICTICGHADFHENPVARHPEFRHTMCHECSLKYRYLAAEIRDSHPEVHPLALQVVPQVANIRGSIVFLPDALIESHAIQSIEASSILAGKDPTTASQDYVLSRRDELREFEQESWQLEDCGYEYDCEERVLFEEQSRSYCQARLASLGYRREDYAFLEEEDWWCCCVHAVHCDCGFYWEDESPFHQWVNEEDARDCELASRTVTGVHGGCIDMPEDFWRYWVDGNYCHDDYGDRKPEDQEWHDLKSLYREVAERRQERRVPRAWDARLNAFRANFVELIREQADLAMPGAPATLDHLWRRASTCASLPYCPREKLKVATSLIVTNTFLSFLSDKAHLDKIRLFIRIATALRHDDPACLPASLISLLDHVESRAPYTGGKDFLKTYYRGLGDCELDPISTRATALLRCGFCSRKMLFDEMTAHLVDEHEAGPVTAFAHIADAGFRRAMYDLLASLQLPHTTAFSELRAVQVDVVERLPSEVLLTSHEQSWDEVFCGKSDCELPRARRHVDGAATERQIVALRPAHAR